MFDLQKLFRRRPHATAPAAPLVPAKPVARPPNQKLMTLAERMAFRQEMVFESVREVLVNHGVPPLTYRLAVHKQDDRGHRYAVMVDLDVAKSGRIVDAPAEWAEVEAQAIRTASQRYRVTITAVYWRVEAKGLSGANSRPAPLQAEPGVPRGVVAEAQRDRPPSPSDQVGSLRAVYRAHTQASKKEEEFPDTQRLLPFEGITVEELMAFEDAVRKGQVKQQQPVQVGARTYQSDFMPLK